MNVIKSKVLGSGLYKLVLHCVSRDDVREHQSILNLGAAPNPRAQQDQEENYPKHLRTIDRFHSQ